MQGRLFDFVRPVLHAFDPETAHEITLKSLEAGVFPGFSGRDDASLVQTVFGLEFPNPLGIAAGFDKNGRVVDAMLGMGCGFAEIGTVTPLAQPGNARPRVFRIATAGAVINRLGFNNEGHAAALERLRRRADQGRSGIVGINIGANKTSQDRIGDYVAGLDTFYDVASYFTVNISSPNTPGLRDLQAPEALDGLLGRLMERREKLEKATSVRRPVIVKISPDLAEDDVAGVTAHLVAHGVDGIAVSNTTLSRQGVVGKFVSEEGGLSGRPLFHRSTVMLARVYQETGGKIPLIGIGGLSDGNSALAKIEAGARLLQLYTGLIFQGPDLIAEIKTRLAQACRDKEVSSIGQLCGRDAATWAAKPIEAV